MRRCFVVAIVIIGSCVMLAQQPPSSAAPGNQASNPTGKTAPDKAQPKRVVADLSGFELDPKKSKSQNGMQIGAGSRGASLPPALYAPSLGKAYDLRPVFSWGTSPGAQKFTFRLYDSDDDEIYEQAVEGNLRAFAYLRMHLHSKLARPTLGPSRPSPRNWWSRRNRCASCWSRAQSANPSSRR